MDGMYHRKPNSGTAGMSERFGYGRETNNYGGSSKLQDSHVSPGFEDYGDIFGSFRGSGASSIPIINIPAVEEDEVFFDVGISEFEYREVFGEFDVLDFEIPHEALIDQPKGGEDDSIKESGTPVGTESLGCCEVSEGGKKGGSNLSPFQKSLQLADNNNSKQDFSVEMGTENGHQTQNASPPDGTVLAVSNIVLKTKPSQILPPCRPPPIVHVQEDCMVASSSQASTSCRR